MPIKKQTTTTETIETETKKPFLKKVKTVFIIGFVLTILILGIWYCISQSPGTPITNQPQPAPAEQQAPPTGTTPTGSQTPQPAKINEETPSKEDIEAITEELVTIREDVDKLKTTKPQPTNNNEISSLNKQNKEQKEKIDKLENRLSAVELKNIGNTSTSQIQTPSNTNKEPFPKTDLTKMPSFEKLIGFKDEREAADRFLTFLKSIGNLPNIGEVKVPTGILLHGVAGTGKTTFAQALAKEVKLPFFNTSASQFSKGTVGEAPQMVRDLFATARKEAQKSGGAIIFIDECEEVFKDLTDNQSKTTADTVNIINEFKAQMTSYENDPKKPVFLMAATNHVNKIDEAIKSRFSYMIEIKPGDFEERKQMFEFLINKRKNPYSPEAKDYLLNVVNGALDKLPPYKRANRILTGILDEAVSTLVLESNKTTPPRTQINIDDIKTAYRLRVDKDTGLLDIFDNHKKQQQDDTNKPKPQDDTNKPKSPQDDPKPQSK
jgi:cell division protease FtsH